MIRSARLRLGLHLLALPVLAGFAACASTGGFPSQDELEQAVVLDTDRGPVHGTLVLAPRPYPQPVALLVAGAGPTDRDGNTASLGGDNDHLKLLAEAMAARGVASVRYDKWGVGQSRPEDHDEAGLTVDLYAEDAAAWVEELRRDRRFSRVVVIGHSEGSLIGALAAGAGTGRADGYVSVAGLGRPGQTVLRERLEKRLRTDLLEAGNRVLDTLEAGETTDDVPEELDRIFRPALQPYLLSWFRHDPAEVVASLDMPVLLVQGTTDIQVPVSEAEVLHAARPRAELVRVEGMNHIFKTVPDDGERQADSYVDPSLPVADELVRAVVDFVLDPREPR